MLSLPYKYLCFVTCQSTDQQIDDELLSWKGKFLIKAIPEYNSLYTLRMSFSSRWIFIKLSPKQCIYKLLIIAMNLLFTQRIYNDNKMKGYLIIYFESPVLLLAKAEKLKSLCFHQGESSSIFCLKYVYKFIFLLHAYILYHTIQHFM